MNLRSNPLLAALLAFAAAAAMAARIDADHRKQLVEGCAEAYAMLLDFAKLKGDKAKLSSYCARKMNAYRAQVAQRDYEAMPKDPVGPGAAAIGKQFEPRLQESEQQCRPKCGLPPATQ